MKFYRVTQNWVQSVSGRHVVDVINRSNALPTIIGSVESDPAGPRFGTEIDREEFSKSLNKIITQIKNHVQEI